MVDSIQTSSTLPLPDFQTTQGSRDPLPVAGPEQAARDTARVDQQTHDTLTADFEAYLNNSAVLHLEAERSDQAFDAAQEIANNSVYKAPGQSTPI